MADYCICQSDLCNNASFQSVSVVSMVTLVIVCGLCLQLAVRRVCDFVALTIVLSANLNNETVSLDSIGTRVSCSHRTYIQRPAFQQELVIVNQEIPTVMR